MNENLNKRGIAVGFFIIVGLAFLVGGVLTVGNLHSTFQRKMTVSTLFGDVDGLQSGNNVWFSGVKIGTVKRTEFYGKHQVRVIININTESKEYIRKDAKVKISTDGLIGNKIIVIYGGSSDVEAVEEGDTLANELKLSTEDIMNTFQQNNLNVLALTKKLADGEGTLGRLLNSDSVYRTIFAAGNSLQRASAGAEQVMGSLNEFSARLNKTGGLVNSLVSDTLVFSSLKKSVFTLHTITDTTAAFVSTLKQASGNKKSALGVLLYDEQAGADLKATLTNLQRSSLKLDEDLEGLQHSFLLKRYFKKKKNSK